jgi:hypothetical protein
MVTEDIQEKDSGILSTKRRQELASEEAADGGRNKASAQNRYSPQHSTHSRNTSPQQGDYPGPGRDQSLQDPYYEPPRSTRDTGILSPQRRSELEAKKHQFANERADHRLAETNNRRLRAAALRSPYQTGQKVKIRCQGKWYEGQVSRVDVSESDPMYDIFVKDGRHTWEEHRVPASRIQESQRASETQIEPSQDTEFARRRMLAVAAKQDSQFAGAREPGMYDDDGMSGARQRLGQIASGGYSENQGGHSR